jgi:signal transduction histidine kinase
MEEHPERFDEDMQQMGELLHTAMGFISGLFEQSRSIKYLSQLPTANVTISKIVTLAVSLVREKARERKVTVTVHMQKPNAKVCVNQFALARVLLNLIRNAIEAVQPNTGRVHLIVDALDEQVECAVQDNGPGIPPRFIEQVFEARFTTKADGMGLGLYICKHLVQSMNGTLSVHNEPGQGCRFSIRIPRVL